jgi:formylglycine-generating enzyme
MRKIVVGSLMVIGMLACHSSPPPAAPEETPNVCTPDNCPLPPKKSEGVKVESSFVVKADPPACNDGMVHVVGNYCPNVEQKCLEWMSKEEIGKPWARCKRYQAPSICLSKKRVHMDYCIDREELHDDNGVPYDVSWTDAQKMCAARGAHLCNEEQWNMACEGEDMIPYPYGDGYSFSNTTCNIERHPIMCGGKLCDYRGTIADFPNCVSLQYHVHNLVGSNDDWVEVPRYTSSKVSGLTMRSGLKGGTMFGGRHRCRPITKDHGEEYRNFTTAHCCASSNPQ